MLTCIFIIIVIIGEFGIVYRAHLVKNSLKSVTTLPVAVKMMKGIVIVTYSPLQKLYISLILLNTCTYYYSLCFVFLAIN